jgi:predicted transcriptional regulator
MSDIINSTKNIVLSIHDKNNHDYIARLGKAMSVPERIRIMEAISLAPMNLMEISKKLDIPLASVSRHIDALSDAQLIFLNYQPGLKGHTKMCSKMALSAGISFEDSPVCDTNKNFKVEMPLGLFRGCSVTAPCGLLSNESPIGKFDDPSAFFLPESNLAECLWFDIGFIDYIFPNPRSAAGGKNNSLSFSFELCSEAVYYNNNWPSDITVLINGVEAVTFTSPGDFGGRRGHFTPEFWPVTSTQFGLLKTVTVAPQGVYLDNALYNSKLSFSDFNINGKPFIKFSIGIKPDAVHRGGINLFGKNFGDFPQAIIMTMPDE